MKRGERGESKDEPRRRKGKRREGQGRWAFLEGRMEGQSFGSRDLEIN